MIPALGIIYYMWERDVPRDQVLPPASFFEFQSLKNMYMVSDSEETQRIYFRSPPNGGRSTRRFAVTDLEVGFYHARTLVHRKLQPALPISLKKAAGV